MMITMMGQMEFHGSCRLLVENHHSSRHTKEAIKSSPWWLRVQFSKHKVEESRRKVLQGSL